MVRPKYPFFLAILLASCGSKSDDKSAPADDTSAQTDDTVPADPYGPDNSWYHAQVSDLPEDLSGSTWASGEVMPNFFGTDQFGDPVELYQFYGRTVILDIAGEWCGPCHDFAPYVEHVWEEVQDEAVVVTVMVDDISMAPADSEAVARWVEEEGSTNPVIWLDEGSYDLFESTISSWPTIPVLDPTMRMGVTNMQTAAGDAWISQVTDRLVYEVNARLGDTEVCDDGIDNDMDLQADCMASACGSEPTCAPQEFTGSLQPCSSEGGTAGVDIWQVEITSGVAVVELDTLSADTTFEARLVARRPGEDWNSAGVVGDDEQDCTYQPANFSCPLGWLRPGSWELVVQAGNETNEDGDCANPDLGEYVLRVQGAGTFTLLEDDVAAPY